MNERIEKLAEQAKVHVLARIDEDDSDWDDQHTVLYNQKFAELIVRECMTNLYIKGHDDAVIQLREEFGVEL
jgi:hypothetical protein